MSIADYTAYSYVPRLKAPQLVEQKLVKRFKISIVNASPPREIIEEPHKKCSLLEVLNINNFLSNNVVQL